MGTHAAVVFANVTVAFLEVKPFIRLPEIFSRDVVEFFIKNYFRFLDDLNYKWKQNIDITPLWKLINELHPDIQFIFENLSSEVKFLDVKCTIDNNQMFDIYHKPTHSFSYLHYKSCHPRHTRDNIALSLGHRIVRLVSEDRQLRLQQLKSELIKRGYPAKIIDDTFNKLLTPVRDRSSTALESIPFIYTYNPGTKFNKNKITKC